MNFFPVFSRFKQQKQSSKDLTVLVEKTDSVIDHKIAYVFAPTAGRKTFNQGCGSEDKDTQLAATVSAYMAVDQ